MPNINPERALLDYLQTGVVQLDANGCVLHWNRWFRSHLGSDPGDPCGKSLAQLFPEVSGSRLESSIEQALHFRLSSVITPSLHRPLLPLFQKPTDIVTGERMHQLLQITAPRISGVAVLVQITDMTAPVQRERKLRLQSSELMEASFRDPLTGAGNRRLFDESFAKLYEKAERDSTCLAVVMIDVDDFRAYTNQHGIAAGNTCLQQVAQALQLGLRVQAGDILCRHGSEVFAALMPNTDEATANTVAERLRQIVETLGLAHGAAATADHITVSVGVTASTPQPGQPSHVLITGADLALYQAKETGRNRVMCYSMTTNEIAAVTT